MSRVGDMYLSGKRERLCFQEPMVELHYDYEMVEGWYCVCLIFLSISLPGIVGMPVVITGVSGGLLKIFALYTALIVSCSGL